jgi:hypothetical protein
MRIVREDGGDALYPSEEHVNTITVDSDQSHVPDRWEAAKAAAVAAMLGGARRSRGGRPRGRIDAGGGEGRTDAPPESVDRADCPRCGTRADIGCRHRRARLSMGAW